MERIASVERKTNETEITLRLNLDGSGQSDISTGIPFFDHMLTLFSVHGFFDLYVVAKGDLEVDFHHTVEDVGLVLGEALGKALGERRGIVRYGHAVTPMDDALSAVTVDLSNRPYLIFNVPRTVTGGGNFGTPLSREFFRAFSNRSGMNLHISVNYGEDEHHIIESVFKALGRALDQAVSFDQRITGVHSSKGEL
jgi:imidazoleglycerol-phosphate dehydratase